MKNFGSKSEYADERAYDLMRAYTEYIRCCKKINMADVFKRVVNMPASRFWISVERASVVVSNIMNGDKLLYMRPNKREMFLEIHRRFLLMREKSPDEPMYKLVAAVVIQPAPKFYLAPSSAKVIIIKMRKKWFREKMKRLHR